MIRNAFARLNAAFARPSTLPGSVVLALTMLILTQAAVLLINQPPAYWLDPRNHMPDTPLGFLLERGVWVFVPAMLVYAAVLAALMMRLGRAPAWLLAGWVFMFHLVNLTWISYCGWTSILPFVDKQACAVFQYAVGFSWAIGVVVIVTVALLPGRLPAGRGRLILSFVLPAWLLALVFGVVHAASFTGSAWQPLAPEHSPGRRFQSAVAYDTRRMRAVLFGGATLWTGSEWVFADDTWEWDGQDWTEIPTPEHPSGRAMHGMAYDPVRGVVVLYGGYNRDGALADTWEWDGTAWRQPCTCGPEARYGHQLVYDPGLQKVVVLGGYNGEDWVSSSCAWDGKTWAYHGFDNLTPLFYADSMAYDVSAGRALAFLGETSWGGAWTLTDGRWARLPDPHGPPLRDSSAMVYDPDDSQIILFGGRSGPTWLNDTWIFKDGAWRQLDSGRAPSARTDAAAFYDLKRHSLILYGGEGASGRTADMWELNVP